MKKTGYQQNITAHGMFLTKYVFEWWVFVNYEGPVIVNEICEVRLNLAICY